MADQAVPPRLLVLPKESTEAARILTLAHPRTSKPSRYYFDPTHGIYEFTRVAAPKAACRSWLLKSQPKGQLAQKEDSKEAPTDQDMTPKEDDQKPTEVVESTPNDYVMKSAEILVATPIDILFILLPSLSDQKLFLSADDLLDRLSERSKHFAHIMAYGPTRQQMEGRLKAVCDTVDAGDEQMYRLNEEKLLAELLLKAKNMVTSGLPASMEERFVRRALDTPLAVVKREEVSISEASQGTDTPMSETTVSETMESQTSTATADSTSTAASAGTEITIPGDVDGKDTTDLKHLLRLRTALSYMLSSYIPSLMAAACVAPDGLREESAGLQTA